MKSLRLRGDVDKLAMGAILAGIGASELVLGLGVASSWIAGALLIGAVALMLSDFRGLLNRGAESTAMTSESHRRTSGALVSLGLIVAFVVALSGVVLDLVKVQSVEKAEICESTVVGREMKILPRSYALALEVKCESKTWRAQYPVHKGHYTRVDRGARIRSFTDSRGEKILKVEGVRRMIWNGYDIALAAGSSFALLWIGLREITWRRRVGR